MQKGIALGQIGMQLTHGLGLKMRAVDMSRQTFCRGQELVLASRTGCD